jgi:hypothetical protein
MGKKSNKMAGGEERQKREVGSARLTWLQLLSGALGTMAVVIGFLWQDEVADTKAVDGNYCIKHYDELENKYFKAIDEKRDARKMVFKLKAQHLADSINLANCK